MLPAENRTEIWHGNIVDGRSVYFLHRDAKFPEKLLSVYKCHVTTDLLLITDKIIFKKESLM